jgi:hypothetical protein
MTRRKSGKTERGRFLRLLVKTVAIAFLAGAVAAVVFWIAWEPRPETEIRFDRELNGLWVGHKWFTGVSVRGDEPVTDAELEVFAETVSRHSIRYLYLHVGPVLADGSIEDSPSPLLDRLMARSPEVIHLAWLGGLTGKFDLEDPQWVAGFLETAAEMMDLGFDGVHLNFEPLRDHHPGYVELLAALKEHLGPDAVLSHATRRSAPFGLSLGFMDRYFWSADFYRQTMAHADQTVLMGYDTGLDTAEHYLTFLSHQTRLLVDWASDFPGHQVLIGIPSYEEGSPASDPLVENVTNGALGVRAGLEKEGTGNGAFTGVAIYANWVTDDREWADFRHFWMEKEEE